MNNWILIIQLISLGQFATTFEINFQEFSSVDNCVNAGERIKKSNKNFEVIYHCVEK